MAYKDPPKILHPKRGIPLSPKHILEAESNYVGLFMTKEAGLVSNRKARGELLSAFNKQYGKSYKGPACQRSLTRFYEPLGSCIALMLWIVTFRSAVVNESITEDIVYKFFEWLASLQRAAISEAWCNLLCQTWGIMGDQTMQSIHQARCVCYRSYTPFTLDLQEGIMAATHTNFRVIFDRTLLPPDLVGGHLPSPLALICNEYQVPTLKLMVTGDDGQSPPSHYTIERAKSNDPSRVLVDAFRMHDIKACIDDINSFTNAFPMPTQLPSPGFLDPGAGAYYQDMYGSTSVNYPRLEYDIVINPDEDDDDADDFIPLPGKGYIYRGPVEPQPVSEAQPTSKTKPGRPADVQSTIPLHASVYSNSGPAILH